MPPMIVTSDRRGQLTAARSNGQGHGYRQSPQVRGLTKTTVPATAVVRHGQRPWPGSARRIALLPGLARTVEGILRASIAACPCQPVPACPRDPDAQCPALNAKRLLEAISHATR